MRARFGFAVLALGLALCLGAVPCPAARYQTDELSPSGSLRVKQRWRHPKESEIWIFTTHKPRQKFLLQRFGRNVEILFSPDERLLAVTDNYGSDASEVILYRRESGARYTRLEDTGVEKKTRELFLRETGRPADLDILHGYVRAVAWSEDASALLLLYTADWVGAGARWFCMFDLARLEVSARLERLNGLGAIAPAEAAGPTPVTLPAP